MRNTTKHSVLSLFVLKHGVQHARNICVLDKHAYVHTHPRTINLQKGQLTHVHSLLDVGSGWTSRAQDRKKQVGLLCNLEMASLAAAPYRRLQAAAEVKRTLLKEGDSGMPEKMFFLVLDLCLLALFLLVCASAEQLLCTCAARKKRADEGIPSLH